MTKINISEAVRRGFGSRARLNRAIRQGTLEAVRQANGHILLDVAQLERLFQPADAANPTSPPKSATAETAKTAASPARSVRRSCLLILGMHRSGTSALTRCLSLLGASLPPDLIGGDRSNESGYWESINVNVMHEALLKSNASKWDDWSRFDQRWYGSPEFRNYKSLLKNYVTDNFDSTPLFVLKDPRICRFVPLWRSILDELEIDLLAVLPIRNPLEVAKSLHARDGIGASRACLIWLRHVLEAEVNTRDVPRVFIRYEDLLTDPVGTTAAITQSLKTRWLKTPASVEEDMRKFLDGELRHSLFTPADLQDRPELGEWTSVTFKALCALKQECNMRGAMDTLDRMRRRLDDMEPVWRNVIDEAEEAVRAPLIHDLATTQEQRDNLSAEGGRLEAELVQHEARINALGANISELTSAAQRLNEDLAQRTQHIADLEAAHNLINAANAGLTEDVEHLNAANAGLNENLEHLGDRVTELDGLRTKLELRKNHLESTLRAERARAGQLDERLFARTSEFDDVKAVLRHSEERAQALEDSLSWRMTTPVRAVHSFLRDRNVTGAKPVPAVQPEDFAQRDSYVPLLEMEPLDEPPVQVIAFYLPQYHPIPENDEWWGRGFTEWTNVTAARPQFAGHYQPHMPGELGYYDLRLADVQKRQTELARLYGIGGFCFYFYWFAGKTLLETPTANYLNNQDLDFPFCICWANENWSRRWDGLDEDVLIGQGHSPEDDLSFIAYVSKYLRDERYIRINGKPVLLVYRPNLLPAPGDTVERWRNWCRDNGIGEIYLAYTQSFESVPPGEYGFDAAIEFPPNNSDLARVNRSRIGIAEDFPGEVFDWTSLLDRSRNYDMPAYRLFRGVCPGWDNTARRGDHGTVLVNDTPDNFQEWIGNAIADTCRRFENPDERLVFVNAWNEWAEGCHLEPDRRYGYAWLQAVRSALQEGGARQQRRIVVVSHDAHPHGAQFLSLNIARCLRDSFGYHVDIVLLGEGTLKDAFADVATIHDLADHDPRSGVAISLANHLLALGATAAICNTTVSGLFAETLKEAGFSVVSLVHELSGVIEGYGLHEHTKSIARNADQIVFAADMVAQSFQAYALIDAAKQVVRPQGLCRRNRHRSRTDLATAGAQLKAQIGVPGHVRLVLSVGYADERKGYDLFVEAAEIVAGQHDDVVFVWVGHHDVNLSERFSKRTETLQEQGKLVLPGLNFNTDLFYAGADLYLLPSREDPYPLTVLDALDVGLPIIGFEGVTGTAGLIQAHDGLLVPPFDVEALVEAINNTLTAADADVRWARVSEFRARPEIHMEGYVHDLLAYANCSPKRVSVIVPNYNYAHYLPERLKSILDQGHPIRELIILDDASSDNSLEVIRELVEPLDIPVRLIANETNSGSVSLQWLRGAEAAVGDYVWIAEADDLADPDFLTEAMKGFDAEDVVLSYTQSKQMAEDGSILCDDYLQYTDDVSPTQWLENYKRGGHDEIRNGLSVKNTIPNVSAVVFRRDALVQTFRDHIDHVAQFRVAGDWCLYVHLLSIGSCRFAARPLNLHRRHDQSVTISRFSHAELDEIKRMQEFVATEFDVSSIYRQRSDEYRSELSSAFNL